MPVHKLIYLCINCRTMPVILCPREGCKGTLTVTKLYSRMPSGPMQCTDCTSTFQHCRSDKDCSSAVGPMQPQHNFSKKRQTCCDACTGVKAAAQAATETESQPEAQEQDCQGTLKDACSVSGKCKGAVCAVCAPDYTKQVKAMYAFLRASLLAEVADGGQKLEFVVFGGPLHRICTEGKTYFPKKDISFVFELHTPEAIRQLAASLQQKFEDAGGRSSSGPSGKGGSKTLPASRMFWQARVPDLKNTDAQTGGKQPWCKGLQGCYYLQRLQVIKLSNPTAFNYQQHLSSLRRVFSDPGNYIMQAPRESYSEAFGGYWYKKLSIYQLPMSATTSRTDGEMLHGAQLQRVFSIKTCPTDELMVQTLRKA